MNGFMTFNPDQSLRLANERINERRAEADAERLARKARRPGRLATALASIRTALTMPADRPVVPLLSDYPYRS